MAKMTTAEAKAFLKSDVGLTDDQLVGYTDAHLKKVAEGLMRQSDYDSSMNAGKAELAASQQQLQEASDRLTAEMAEWGRVQAEDGKITAKMRGDLEKAQSDVLRLTQTVNRVATEHGLDPDKLLGGVVPPKVETPPAVDLSGYVKADQFAQQIDSLANLAVTLPAELHALSVEHQTLFGKPLDAQAIVKELKARAATRGNQKSLDVRQIWEDQHKVPDARAAADKKRFDDAIADAEKRGREAAYSESAIPGSMNAPGKHAPVFHQDRKSAVNRPQPGGTINAAVAAFRSGKYRTTSKAS